MRRVINIGWDKDKKNRKGKKNYEDYSKEEIKEKHTKTKYKDPNAFLEGIIILEKIKRKDNLEPKYYHVQSLKNRLKKDIKFMEKCELFDIKKVYRGISRESAEKIEKELKYIQMKDPYPFYTNFEFFPKEKKKILKQLDKELLIKG